MPFMHRGHIIPFYLCQSSGRNLAVSQLRQRWQNRRRHLHACISLQRKPFSFEGPDIDRFHRFILQNRPEFAFSQASHSSRTLAEKIPERLYNKSKVTQKNAFIINNRQLGACWYSARGNQVTIYRINISCRTSVCIFFANAFRCHYK